MIRIWSYDVWGNKKDGFEINDRYEIGTYKDLSREIFSAKDADIIKFLKDEGHLAKGTHLASFQIDGDGDRYLTIDYKNCPVIEITRED